MVYLRLALLAVRTVVFIVASLAALFAGYIGVERASVGVRDARAAYDELERVQAEQRALHTRRGALLEEQAVLIAALHEAAAQVGESSTHFERAEDARLRALQGLGAARAQAWPHQWDLDARFQRLEQTFDIGLGEIPRDPVAFNGWVDRASARVDQICTVQWRDITELQRVQGYVAGNLLSDACGHREDWFTQLRRAGATWQDAAEATARAEQALASRQADVEAFRVALDRTKETHAAQERTAEEHAQSVAALDGQLAELDRRETALQRSTSGTTGWVAGFRMSAHDARDWLLNEWRRVWPRVLGVFVALVAAPYVYRAVLFWVVAPLVTRARPLTFRPERPPSEPCVAAAHASERTARVSIPVGRTLLVRPDHLRQVPRGASRTRFFLPAEWPIQSWALGFFGWTEVGGASASGLEVTLAASRDDAADTYIVRVNLQDHPGLVIHPGHVIAISDGLELFARWRFAWHALAMGKLRYIQLRGTGTVWFEGYGDVTGALAGPVESHQDAGSYLGWDSRLQLRMCRRETAYPYLLGQVHLFELGVRSDDEARLYVWQKADGSTGGTPLERTAGALFSAIGKLLGF